MTDSSRPTRLLPALLLVALLGMAAALAMIFLYAPEDALEGPVQRIFYVHVSAAIAGFACFGVVGAASAVYLWREPPAADRLARAAATVGLVLISTNIAMGILWAKPIWNWDPSQTWDARFTTTVVLWMIYAAYLLVRKFATPGRQSMRLAAVVGIFGLIDVPIVYESVNWWRTLHPAPVLAAAGGPALPPAMLLTFLVTLACTSFLAGVMVAIRYRIETVRDERLQPHPVGALEPAR